MEERGFSRLSRCAVWLFLVGLPAGCGGSGSTTGGATCGEGTVLVEHRCELAGNDGGALTCGPGTSLVGHECRPVTGDAGEVTCGSGTTLVGNECRPIPSEASSLTCGPGTVAVGNECRATDAGVDAATDATTERCGPGTFDDGGVCMPASDCNAPIACADPGTGRFSICGRAFDLQDSSPLAGGVKLSVYDMLQFLQNPSTASAGASVVTDACGRFALTNVAVPGGSFALIAADDADASSDKWALTATARPVSNGAKIANTSAWALRRTTDTGWSSAVGLTGSTLADRGILVGIFIDPTKSPVAPFSGAPVAGVVATRSGVSAPANDEYFSDVAALSRTTIEPAQSLTGVDGTVVLTGASSLEYYGGTGAEPVSCHWPSTLSSAPAGVVVVQEFNAVCP